MPEKADDPSLANTGLFRLRCRGSGRRVCTVCGCSAGGDSPTFAAMHDSFPHCLHLSRSGVNGFAVIFRPDAQLACEDLARAVSFIFEHADELSVDTSGYSLWGGSASARISGTGQRLRAGHLGAPAGMPQPVAAVVQYTGMAD